MPRAPGDAGPHDARRHGRTTRGSHPTAGPSAGRPRAGSGSARARADREELLPDGPAARRTAARQPLGPGRWISRRSPQTPVRRVGALAEHADVRPERRDRAPAAVHGHERARREAGHDHGAHVDRVAVVLEPGRELGDVLAREVGDGVEHVRPGVEQEAAARHRRILAPGPGGVGAPVLPDEGVDVVDAADLAARDQPRRRPDLRREAAREGDDEQPAGPVAGRDQRRRLGRVHDHGLLEEDVETGLEAGGRLRGVEDVGRDDDHGVEVGRESLDEALPVGLVRRDGCVARREFGRGCGDGGLGGLAQGDDVGVGAAAASSGCGGAPSGRPR